MKLAMIDIATACSAKCKYCLHQYRNMTKSKFMTWENFVAIMWILKNEGYEYIYPYLSGEPLLHKDYWEMIQHISDRSMHSNTASKLCFDIDFDKAEAVFSKINKIAHFDITIDAHSQEVQDKISRGIKTEQVFSNLKNLYEIAQGKNVTFSVVTVVNKFNENHLEAIFDRVKSCGNLKWCAKPMGYYMGYKMQDEDNELIADMAPSNSTRFTINNGKLVSNMKSCRKFIKPVIGVNGEVTICCHDMLYHESKWNILQTGSLDKIIGMENYQYALRCGEKMKLEICKGCN